MFIASHENTELTRNQIINSIFGSQCLDDIIDTVIVYDNKPSSILTMNTCDKLDKIAKQYLNENENKIYDLLKMEKTIANIKEILGFNNWHTAEAHVSKTCQLLKIYYRFSMVDKDELELILKDNFSEWEKILIDLLSKRYTYHEIKNETKIYYRKVYYDCQEVLNKLQKIETYESDELYVFINSIRKFKT